MPKTRPKPKALPASRPQPSRIISRPTYTTTKPAKHPLKPPIPPTIQAVLEQLSEAGMPPRGIGLVLQNAFATTLYQRSDWPRTAPPMPVNPTPIQPIHTTTTDLAILSWHIGSRTYQLPILSLTVDVQSSPLINVNSLDHDYATYVPGRREPALVTIRVDGRHRRNIPQALHSLGQIFNETQDQPTTFTVTHANNRSTAIIQGFLTELTLVINGMAVDLTTRPAWNFDPASLLGDNVPS